MGRRQGLSGWMRSLQSAARPRPRSFRSRGGTKERRRRPPVAVGILRKRQGKGGTVALEKRGVQHIKTMAGLVDGRRTRTSSGALLELSMLEMEKQRLVQEMRRAEQRCAEIRERLTEMGKKGLRLQRFVEKLNEEAQTPQAHMVASPLPIHSAPTARLKQRGVAY